MDDLTAKRVFADRAGATRLLVAAGTGLVGVSIADGRVGEFGPVRRGPAAAVAVGTPGPRRIAVATDEDVLLGAAVGTLEPSGFGPAAGVAATGDRVLAGSPDGTVGVHDGAGWDRIGRLPSPPTAMAADLVGTAEGVVRVVGNELSAAGLEAVNDVARVAGVPHAATASGLYALGNGWLDVLDGDVRVVAGAADGRAHAATVESCFAREEGTWRRIDLPDDARLVAIAYGRRPYALTAAGDLLVGTAGGWRAEPLGLEAPRALAVVETVEG